jgi:hypothetical protein
MRNVSHNSVIVGDAYVEHQLAINWVYLWLKYAPVPTGVKFTSWRRFRTPLSNAAPIISDGYAELETPTRVVCAFVEVDLGNESHGVWKKKIETYLRFAVSGEFQERFSRQQFRVLVVASSVKRTERLQKLIREYTEKIFWMTTMAQVRTQGAWATIWLRPKPTEPQPLVGVPS